jgi:hypothetical protein
MNYKSLVGKPYLSAEDLPENTDIPVIIAKAEREEAYNKKTREKEPIGVIAFQGKDLRLILNVTNATSIKNLYGAETDNWIGQPIIIYRTTARLGRDTVAAIRIKPPINQ